MKVTYKKDEYEKLVRYSYLARIDGAIGWETEDPSCLKLIKKLMKDLKKMGIKGLNIQYSRRMIPNES